MDFIFNYETAKHTLVLTAYWMLIIFDFYWIGYLIISAIKWSFKKIKGYFSRKKAIEESREDTANE